MFRSFLLLCESFLRSHIGAGLVASLFFGVTATWADSDDNPPPIAGWTHTPALAQDTPQQHGIILPGGEPDYSSPVIAEIDGDTANGEETAVVGADGIIYVYRSNGTLLWQDAFPNYGCGGKNQRAFSTPAVGTIFGNGIPYVVVGYGGWRKAECDGGVIAYQGATGARAWVFSIKRFADKENFWAFRNTVYSSPALADTDGDGQMEIGFGSFDRNVYLLNADGTIRWYYQAADTVWSSPAFANVDSDPDLEMIIGTDISANKYMRPPTKNGGYVYAFKTKQLPSPRKKRKGRRVKVAPKVSFRDKKIIVWQTYLDQVVYSSPVVADVMPENPGAEVLIGSGCFFPQNSQNKNGKWVKILRASDGAVLQTLNTIGCFSSNVAVGDLDDDGINEIVATVNGHTSIGGDGDSRISAWKASNPTPMWSIVPKERGRNDAWGGTLQSPVIADLDGNGSLEVLAANGSTVGIFNGRDGSPLTCQEVDCGSTPLTLFASRTLKATPAVGDVDGDGKPEVVIGGAHTSTGGHGVLYGWTGLTNLLGSPAGAQPAYSAPWPMFRGTADHRGVLP